MQTWSPFLVSAAARAAAPSRLCRTFRAISVRTQVWLTEGRANGLVPSETSITDLNLFELVSRHPREVHVRRFTARAEAENGGDWEWAIGSGRLGWLRMRVQAKKLDDAGMAYTYLGHTQSNGTRQVDNLISDAGTMPAIYCLYNGQPGPTLGLTWGASCEDASELSGCMIAPAAGIQTLVNAADHSLGSVAPISVPWSDLVCCGPDPDKRLERIQDRLEAMGAGRGQVDQDLPTWASRLLERARVDDLVEVEGLEGVVLIDIEHQ